MTKTINERIAELEKKLPYAATNCVHLDLFDLVQELQSQLEASKKENADLKRELDNVTNATQEVISENVKFKGKLEEASKTEAKIDTKEENKEFATGIIDKNGHEIYVGDFVKTGRFQGVVQFGEDVEGRYYFVTDEKEGDVGLITWDPSRLEIIVDPFKARWAGNIKTEAKPVADNKIEGLPWKMPEHYFTGEEKHLDIRSAIWDQQKGFVTVDDLITTIESMLERINKLEEK